MQIPEGCRTISSRGINFGVRLLTIATKPSRATSYSWCWPTISHARASPCCASTSAERRFRGHFDRETLTFDFASDVDVGSGLPENAHRRRILTAHLV